jgi:hypothetical protein
LDDPGLLLRIQQPHILRSLSVMNVCDLPLGESHNLVNVNLTCNLKCEIEVLTAVARV